MIWKELNLASLLQHAMRSNVADGSKADIGKSRSDDRIVPIADISSNSMTSLVVLRFNDRFGAPISELPAQPDFFR